MRACQLIKVPLNFSPFMIMSLGLPPKARGSHHIERPILKGNRDFLDVIGVVAFTGSEGMARPSTLSPTFF